MADRFTSTTLVQSADETQDKLAREIAKADLDLLRKINLLAADIATQSEEIETLMSEVAALQANPLIIEGSRYLIKKWSDGTMEQWVQVPFSGNVTTASGNVFRSDTISLGNWPVPFITLSNTLYSLTTDTAIQWVGCDTTPSSITIMGSVFIIDTNSSAGVTATISIYGFGKWK